MWPVGRGAYLQPGHHVGGDEVLRVVCPGLPGVGAGDLTSPHGVVDEVQGGTEEGLTLGREIGARGGGPLRGAVVRAPRQRDVASPPAQAAKKRPRQDSNLRPSD